MHWNYRVMRDADDCYTVRDVYYDDDGNIFAWGEKPTNPLGEDLESLRNEARRILKCMDQPILDEIELLRARGFNGTDDAK